MFIFDLTKKLMTTCYGKWHLKCIVMLIEESDEHVFHRGGLCTKSCNNSTCRAKGVEERHALDLFYSTQQFRTARRQRVHPVERHCRYGSSDADVLQGICCGNWKRRDHAHPWTSIFYDLGGAGEINGDNGGGGLHTILRHARGEAILPQP